MITIKPSPAYCHALSYAINQRIDLWDANWEGGNAMRTAWRRITRSLIYQPIPIREAVLPSETLNDYN